MARVYGPPPKHTVSPRIHVWPAAHLLWRIYNPKNHGATARGFRRAGPFVRFDHHNGVDDRGVLYAADSLAGALVEIYGDVGGGPTGDFRYCALSPTRPLSLLDLRGDGAIKAGTILAVSSHSHAVAQKWSRYFYDNPLVYGEIDGIVYSNAHNGEIAVALYERADNGIAHRPVFDRRLSSTRGRTDVLQAISQTGLAIYVG